MPEPTLYNLMIDLQYIVRGTYERDFLFSIFTPKDGAKILEPGCGSAKFTLGYALKDCKTWAIDIDPEVIKYAKKLAKALDDLIGFLYPPVIKLGNIHQLDFPDDTFDLVFNEGVCQHFIDEQERQGSINEMARVSKDSVIIIVSNGLNSREQMIDRTQKFGYKGMPTIRRSFTPEELERRMKKAGLADVIAMPIGGDWKDALFLTGYGRKR